MIAPTILVGCGGIGSQICSQVAKKAAGFKDSSRIRFVCVDTDINDLRKMKEDSPEIITIQTSAPYTLEQYLLHNSEAKEKWFPNNPILLGKTPTEGAGQVRAISRLAFDQAVKEGRMRPLEEAIESLYSLDGSFQSQAIRIIVISTLAGGTGSGMVLPMGLYLRQFLNSRFKKSASVIRGFFLLPEIFYAGKGPSERRSLSCNAYASVKELDSFMRKGDHALDFTLYKKNLNLGISDPYLKKTAQYEVSPYNFVFLYDKRNADDLQLNSIADYKEAAANTIYALALSGASSRSNSNEDNALKAILESQGRNRFCGSGSSMLLYPREEILNYIASSLCVEAMGEEWNIIDKKYELLVKELKEQKKTDPEVLIPTFEDYFLDEVEVEHNKKSSFEHKIWEMCQRSVIKDDGESDYSPKSAQFIDELKDVAAKALASDSEYSRELNIRNNFEKQKQKEETEKKDRKDISQSEKPNYSMSGKQKPSVLGNSAKSYHTQNVKLLGVCIRRAKIIGRSLGQELFADSTDWTESSGAGRIEKYLRDSEDRFIHPTAVRYFLIDLKHRFHMKADTVIRDLEKGIPAYDDPNTPDRVETLKFYIDVLTDKKTSKKDKVKYKQTLDELAAKLEKRMPDYGQKLIEYALYDSAQKYLKKMLQSFEDFYNIYNVYLNETRSTIRHLPDAFENGKGKSTRYVFSTRKCLDHLKEETRNAVSVDNINGKLCALIFQNMKEYSMATIKPKPEVFFRSLYYDTIIKYFASNISDKFGSLLNIDVLTALENEILIEHDYNISDQEVLIRVSRVLEELKNLANPFIESPIAELRHPFTVASFNPSIYKDGDVTRAQFVRKHIVELLGGEQDSSLDSNQLLVLSSIYNLNAADLMRFNAPREGNENGGDYYNAYMETITKLSPFLPSNHVVTPHIDKHWHLPKYMPDLDDYNQQVLEDKINQAFLWGVISGKIEQNIDTEFGPDKEHYIYQPTEHMARDFIVSNGTFCDELYEVLDAFSINLPQVKTMLDDFDYQLERDVDAGRGLYSSFLINAMNWDNREYTLAAVKEKPQCKRKDTLVHHPDANPITLPQYYKNGEKPSVFDLVYWVKKSTPKSKLEDTDLTKMAVSLIHLLDSYVQEFENGQNYPTILRNILFDQFALFTKNLAQIEMTSVRDPLDDPVVRMIESQIDKHMRQYSKIVKSSYNRTLKDMLDEAKQLRTPHDESYE